jgi:hypothetical protein
LENLLLRHSRREQIEHVHHADPHTADAGAPPSRPLPTFAGRGEESSKNQPIRFTVAKS